MATQEKMYFYEDQPIPWGTLVLRVKGKFHLDLVLIKETDKNTYHRYIIWFHNKDVGGYGQGDYCKTLQDALLQLHKRMDYDDWREI